MVKEPDRFYRVSQWIPRTLWRALVGLQIDGLENVPETGAFLLISNHQSNLDPIFIQACCPRAVHTMAKSSQFAVPGVGWYIKRLLAFPVRRYQPDPQAVRIALRRLAEGKAVGVYIEGERSWDARLQAPRIGTLHLILKAGVPVIPCTIAGSYDAWPRWHPSVQLQPIRVTFGEPMRFPKLDRRRDRERILRETGDVIMATLARQLGSRSSVPVG
jgi:1-acyl-sn-glycerol-3-phosphate acyltransferase